MAEKTEDAGKRRHAQEGPDDSQGASAFGEAPVFSDISRPAESENEQHQVKALAEALSVSSDAERERLERIMNLLPCYVALINTNQQIIFHNKAFEDYFGVPEGRACYKALRDQDARCRFCPMLNSLDGSGNTGVMEWIHPNNGHAFRVYSYSFTDVDGTTCLLEAGFNITANLRVQQALNLSEQSYRVITDNLSIGIALIDPQLRIKAGNIRLSRWFAEGFRLDRRVCELLQCGEHWSSAAEDKDINCPDCPFKASLADGQGHEKELAVTFSDGKERIVRLVTCPITTGKLGTERVRALVLMLEDITNRLRVNQQLHRARKIEAMSTLASGIAHEINQPLSALHLYASGLQMLFEKQGALSQETTQERIGLIMREAEKIRSIITHMRALVMREGRVPLTSVSLAAGVENALALLRNQLQERKVQTEVDIPEALPRVVSNELQLEQVLVNLLSNAMHALDEDVHCQDSALPRRIRVKAYVLPDAGMSHPFERDYLSEGKTEDAPGRVRLEVADSGSGLNKEGERIFDPFFTTRERHEGMGIGLSIVHGLVTLWGGEITAVPRHPELGGAAFFVDLHLAGENVSRKPQP